MRFHAIDRRDSPSPTTPPKSRGPRIAMAFGIVVAIVAIYALSLVIVHYLAKSAPPLQPDLGTKDDTVVLMRLEELKTVHNRLAVNVLVIPEDSMWDQRLTVLTTDTSVRMYPPNDLGDLVYPVGKSPAQVATTIEAHGDPNNWPFDTYTTETLKADVLVGSGDQRQYIDARVEVTGSLDGWEVHTERRISETSNNPDDVIITLQRAKGPLLFDLGICLVLVSLPTLALVVAVPMALGKRKFLPPFATWYAAMLFAVVPLRNFLPGSPPPGSWIDQAVVLWVLIALVVAMSLFIVAWVRDRD
ncbi:hypothetical protein MHAE_15825 [Mycobacterium haemophilum DSM 44634]|uniref:DUF4436 domain-containing protein n=1 Tax=Mycobacterium haemophilum TaxID=29311 RepID=UPI000654C81E|nr:DUF4436 domain-containing protein [Mycobacterium haemophilum]AKN18143.1 hypothetical protein B586_18700 [Mycobacterium haemophilum DSM 44634]MCV7340972.1 DUF4436 domain-containing protein [Mycobacterium haemophilum DSM 44634]